MRVNPKSIPVAAAGAIVDCIGVAVSGLDDCVIYLDVFRKMYSVPSGTFVVE